MHELGVLREIVKTVGRIAAQHHVAAVKHITLQVGDRSGFVPQYLTKLFPVAIDGHPVLQHAELKIETVADDRLLIKDIGY